MRNCKYLFCFAAFVFCVQISFAQLPKTKPAETPAKPLQTVTANSVAPSTEGLHLGRYELYSGVPTMNLGHFVLLANGKYKVAFDTDENNYDETGTYVFHAGTNTIEWLGGMFKNNNWKGKVVKKDSSFRIEFNTATYGESK